MDPEAPQSASPEFPASLSDSDGLCSGLPGQSFRGLPLSLPDGYLYSFLAFFLASKSGIYKNGEHTLEFDDSDIKQLYSKYLPELMTEAEREWIESGIWNSARYLEEMAAIYGKASQMVPEI